MKEPQVAIKFIRLKTGDDLIANCLIDEQNGWVDLENPMRVVISRMNTGSKAVLAMLPWLPLELVANEYASVNLNDIITMVDVKDSFAEYYSNALREYNEFIDDNHLNENFSEESLTEEDMEDENFMEDNLIQEIMDSIKDPKKRILH